MALAALVAAAAWLWVCCWMAWKAWTHDQALFAVAFCLLIGVAPLVALTR